MSTKHARVFETAKIFLSIIGVIATVFGCVFAILAVTIPQAIQIVLPPLGATPEPQVVYITAVPPTQAPSPTLGPTFTPYPTYTPHPTHIPHPTPIPPSPEIIIATNTPPHTPEPSVLFFDDFEDGLDSSWEVASGDVFIVNGKLSASGEVILLVGDRSWTNYTVEFDHWMPSAYSNTRVFVRVQDMDNLVYFATSGFGSRWFIRTDGDAQEVPNSNGSGFGEGSIKTIVIGNEYRAYVGEKRVSSFLDDRYPSGRVGIQLTDRSQIDNFTVVLVEE